KLKEQASTVIVDFFQANAAKYKIKEFGSTFRNLLDIVVSFATIQDKERMLEVCKKAFNPMSSEAGAFWLKAVCDFDFGLSCSILLRATIAESGSESLNVDRFILLFQAVFPFNYGNPDERF